MSVSSSLSSTPPSLSRTGLVTRLRAAGCVFAEEEAELLLSTARTPGELATMLDRRTSGIPLEHTLGWAEFGGIRVTVGPGVFVPRRRTEFLVGCAAELAGRTRPLVLDLCCGSGAVGAALAAELGHRTELHAADIDPVAVRCARRNVAAAGGRVHEGDLYDPLPSTLCGHIDLLVVNAPYVPTGSIDLLPPEARVHEPRVALDGGADGLDVQRRVAATAQQWLAPGGHLLIETSERQAPHTVETFAHCGLHPRVATSGDLDATVVIGTAPTGTGADTRVTGAGCGGRGRAPRTGPTVRGGAGS